MEIGYVYLRNELYRLMMISRKVFWGATNPRRLVGILAFPHLANEVSNLFIFLSLSSND